MPKKTVKTKLKTGLLEFMKWLVHDINNKS